MTVPVIVPALVDWAEATDVPNAKIANRTAVARYRAGHRGISRILSLLEFVDKSRVSPAWYTGCFGRAKVSGKSNADEATTEGPRLKETASHTVQHHDKRGSGIRDLFVGRDPGETQPNQVRRRMVPTFTCIPLRDLRGDMPKRSIQANTISPCGETSPVPRV